MDEKNLEEKIATAKREYKRRWYAKNTDRVREHVRRYWEKKVLNALQAEKADTGRQGGEL